MALLHAAFKPRGFSHGQLVLENSQAKLKRMRVQSKSPDVSCKIELATASGVR